MKHLFLPYDLAVLAKEKGFNEDCLGCYASFYSSTKPDLYTELKEEFNDFDVFVTAPLYQQIMDWFKKEHDILIQERFDGYDILYFNLCVKKIKFANTRYKAIEEAFKLI